MIRSGKLYLIIIAALLAVVLALLLVLVNSTGAVEKESTVATQATVATDPTGTEPSGTAPTEPTTLPTEPTTAPTEPTEPTDPTEPTRKLLTIDRIEEVGDTVVVTTSYGQLKFPYAFTDMIKVEAINDDVLNSATLLFYLQINEKHCNLYAVTFGGEGSDPVGAMDLGEGLEPVLVYVNVYGQPSGLTDGERQAFIATQETFNDVMTSLQEGENFVPVI